ncbi:unnamed protein product [Arabidopsis lyrata]|uniref:Predicted protein n=1 Tax=Arabidopsis lyrata subsp. lyrata TaxID=81972 RepID=D7MSH3_ARALL|nr:predicted protein [Arabidopsis lyrata subsp. lyrata]CAH8280257.1 unnamed protein product [Arabidopsis lyrata]
MLSTVMSSHRRELLKSKRSSLSLDGRFPHRRWSFCHRKFPSGSLAADWVIKTVGGLSSPIKMSTTIDCFSKFLRAVMVLRLVVINANIYLLRD